MADDEMIRVDGYRKGVIFQPCECEPGVMGSIREEGGKFYCATCGKRVKPEYFILMGCSKCPSKMEWLDELSKEPIDEAPTD
jgi:Zn finger protein HypA/HybF involved in hydrogenase expression